MVFGGFQGCLKGTLNISEDSRVCPGVFRSLSRGLNGIQGVKGFSGVPGGCMGEIMGNSGPFKSFPGTSRDVSMNFSSETFKIV